MKTFQITLPLKIAQPMPEPAEDSDTITKKTKMPRVDDNEPQDADYHYSPSLSYELESLILARFPTSDHWKLTLVNKRSLSLLKSGDLYRIRKHINFLEPSVFMLASGEPRWWSFDRHFNSHSRRKLPPLPSDPCFLSGDKESFCAGTHLLVSGREISGLAIWRYDLAAGHWARGPPMLSPRCLFASATCGGRAYVAGGMGTVPGEGVFDAAEVYDPETMTWRALPRMIRKRKLCAGFCMDGRFYVAGGRNEEEGELTCGEVFDEEKRRWEVIPGLVRDDPVRSSHSPPLLAVVENELYSLEAATNQLKVYLKGENEWRGLGRVPLRADCNRGWGVAFKSLGDELLVIGASEDSCGYMAIYTCRPNLESGEMRWRRLDGGGNRLSHFILNCSVMMA
ncbi:galactose oxidase/kelch repeat superfamily protein [Striga asiatica]|uniref:Galactose oxidase/kelch repeat superfamily protein n=1 Tax=Striga asiatica TaxID=4170 RepID=A0A5A7QST9_STRAF|nr:galactose oxidase/kelch repeat superfamily protein [Striga asiatica]